MTRPNADRTQAGLDFIETKISVSREQFHAQLKEGGAMLLEGLLSKGYAQQARHGRIGLTPAGSRALRDMENNDAD